MNKQNLCIICFDLVLIEHENFPWILYLRFIYFPFNNRKFEIGHSSEAFVGIKLSNYIVMVRVWGKIEIISSHDGLLSVIINFGFVSTFQMTKVIHGENFYKTQPFLNILYASGSFTSTLTTSWKAKDLHFLLF